MSDAPWWERIEEGRRVELGFIRLDRVGSARDFEGLTREQALARRAGYQLLVTDWARGYGAVEPIGWQGDGAMIFVGDGGPAQVRDGEEFNSAASRAGLLAVELLQQLLVIGYSVRIAAGCGRVPFHRETGRMGGPDIDRTGHLEHDAPADSAALTEDVYLALPVAMRERCGYLGTTLRDGTVCYVVPATAVKRADGSRFHKEDPERERQRFLRYVESPDVQRLRYVGLKLGRKAPPSLPLLEVFRPLLVVEQERSPPPLPEDPAAPEGEEVLPWRRERSRSKPRPFTDLFREGRRCVVLGDPGSGKSTLLRWLAIIAARGRAACRNNLGVDERMLPVLASVGRLAELRSKLDAAGGAGGASVIEALAAYFHERNAGEESGRLAEFLEKRLSEGGCLLLLDGLDEVAGDRMEVRRWLETFCAAFSQNRFVVTSRSVGYAGFDIPGATRTVVVEPFDEEQVRDYLREWNRSYRAWESNLTPWQREADRPKADAEANEIARLLLGQRGRLGALARNPFLLSGIALVHRSEGRLPPYRVKLYEIFAEALCETWNRARRLGGGDAGAALDYRAEGIPVLGSLAYWMHEHHPTGTAPAADVRNKIAEALVEEIGVAQQEADKASARFLERASDELQLLVPRGPEAFGFLHLTFQEFFAAAYLHSKERFATEALAHWIDPRWEEVILLGTGYMSIIQGRPSAAAAFVRDLMSAEHGWITEVLGKQLFVAFKAVADAPNLAADLHTEVAERFLGRVFDDPLLAGSTPHEVSTTLAHARETPLGGAVVRRLVEFLTPSAGRGTPPRASSAARALGALGDAQAVDPLLAALRDPDEDFRRAAAEALGALGDGRAVEPLLAALRDPDEDFRRAAAQALGPLGDGRAVEPLLAALRDPDGGVRWAAAQALGPLGDGRAFEPLLAAVRRPHDDVRWPAARALGALGDGRAFEPLLAALRDPHELVRGAAAHALGALGDGRAVEPLLAALRDPDEIVRWAAAEALGALGDARAVEPLLRALRDPDEHVRQAAAGALGALGDARAVEPLLAAVRDPAGHGRGAAAQALGALGDGRAVEPLLAALRDPDDHVRGAAAQALGALGDGRAVEPLLAALRDERWGHGNIAFNALWRLSLLPSVWKAAIRRKRTPKRPATARTRRQPQSRKRKKR